MLTVQQAKVGSEGFARDVISKGCMYNIMPDIDSHDWSNGVP